MIQTARNSLRTEAGKFISDKELTGLMSTEELLDASAQASGMDHPAIRRVVAALADAIETAVIEAALDDLTISQAKSRGKGRAPGG
jgi:hypothetical protein